MRAVFIPAARARKRGVILASGVTATMFAVSAATVGLLMSGATLERGWNFGLASLAGIVVSCFGPMLLHLLFAFGPRPKARDVEVLIGPGEVRIPQTGHVIRAQNVIGATTATHDGKFMLHLEGRTAPAPHVFLLAGEEDVDRVRNALGVGHDGSGAVEWPLERSKEWVFAISAAFTNVACTGLALPLLVAWPFLRAYPRALRSHHAVAMTAAGVVVQASRQTPPIAYAQIHKAVVTTSPRALQLYEADGSILAHLPTTFLTEDELGRLASQIETAARRARGEHEARASALERLATLRRGGQPTREWLSRLDASAPMLALDGYRAASIDIQDLWRVAEDPAEAFEDRVGAGRLLLGAQGEAARVRVGEALANLHADPKRVRVALEAPPDEAAPAFAEAEAMMRAR